MEGYVKSKLINSIAIIEFFHPQRNSLPGILLDELANAISSVAADNNCQLIILRSGGEKVFCAGASFEELANIKTTEEGLAFFSGFAKVINAIRKAPQFVIGRIHGKCVGGGVGLAAAVDYAIATDQADIKLSELAVGIGPFVVGPAVERKIGLAAFSQLTIDASGWRNADWALQKGLYAEVFTNIEDADAYIDKLAFQLLQTSPLARQELKKVFWSGTENWDELLMERAAISGRLIVSEYSQKAIAAFKSKQ
jgi:methylglutaconyl-CoA hydratase